MANSSIVSEIKEEIVKSITTDEDILFVIDPDKNIVENGSDLINTYLFKFNKNPDIIPDTKTFICITVELNYRDRNRTFVTPVTNIWIYSHPDHMVFTPEHRKLLSTKISDDGSMIKNEHFFNDSRNDYLSRLLDEKFNGMVIGGRTLKLINNFEGNAGLTFVYRRLIFETVDLNNSLCEEY